MQSLEQFVEDGEDLVNVSLDEHRNRIIAVDVVITGLATAMGLGTAISGARAQRGARRPGPAAPRLWK